MILHWGVVRPGCGSSIHDNIVRVWLMLERRYEATGGAVVFLYPNVWI